eukprot:PhF_6_TR11401/c0_g1_i1/m.18353
MSSRRPSQQCIDPYNGLTLISPSSDPTLESIIVPLPLGESTALYFCQIVQKVNHRNKAQPRRMLITKSCILIVQVESPCVVKRCLMLKDITEVLLLKDTTPVSSKIVLKTSYRYDLQIEAAEHGSMITTILRTLMAANYVERIVTTFDDVVVKKPDNYKLKVPPLPSVEVVLQSHMIEKNAVENLVDVLYTERSRTSEFIENVLFDACRTFHKGLLDRIGEVEFFSSVLQEESEQIQDILSRYAKQVHGLWKDATIQEVCQAEISVPEKIERGIGYLVEEVNKWRNLVDEGEKLLRKDRASHDLEIKKMTEAFHTEKLASDAEYLKVRNALEADVEKLK